ncbi:hypothetical protein Kpol_1042p22 [Vanderwaltozyma polyspora DSM 70294]|uniref:Septin-type G domain-containing protein n=1 Tax=Vanderwaltozyma polyspora (strain ATCC 22028 / DSM 70294 / BCRC 21397 / CBS 2163 / NBRC 10782 / NRRL Y-8283 / UCD 57-17) TaxID=436907 RepID=A7TQA7_VANPO|nr:uncharacterized protein Kpol_1042p22 [Vanderwaltozyma polyspora DSM 70294]EDO15561.1 hypothetical protein Kpol_1042p22 [Vanderwaltozyma polyspora DSM 70294]
MKSPDSGNRDDSPNTKEEEAEQDCSSPMVDLKVQISKDDESAQTEVEKGTLMKKSADNDSSDIIDEYMDISLFDVKCRRVPTISKMLRDRTIITEGYSIGIDQIPLQRERMTAHKGVHFTLMVAGQAGLGKTTFVNTFFGSSILPSVWNKKDHNSSQERTKSITCHTAQIEGYGTKLNLTIIDTPGFGNKLNNAFSWIPLTNFIDDQIRSYIFQEEQPDRIKLRDKRVHCCLYFIEPTNKGLSTLDVVTMKELSKRVNVIPIIAKADSLPKSHLTNFNREIRQIIDVQNIKICNFLNSNDPYYDDIFSNIPFNIIASENHVMNNRGELVLGREYKWAVIEVENPKHSDFSKLKDILINKYMADLVQSTEEYYENCRASLLKTRILKARDICFSSKPPLVDISDELKEFFKTLDYENCDNNGIKNYACYQLFNKKYIDELVLEWCQEYIHRQWEAKRRFNEIVNVEENKFQDWRKAILKRQEKFNNEINSIHKQIESLQIECHDLESRAISSRSGNEKSLGNLSAMVGKT